MCVYVCECLYSSNEDVLHMKNPELCLVKLVDIALSTNHLQRVFWVICRLVTGKVSNCKMMSICLTYAKLEKWIINE